ncbi:SAM-dependent methyltransferase [Bradyrhizobium sp.]|uniref:SAM-dependent methyltransferase n=1 Tax=Bradyrhizobium sp. TaxID=376 RepID=UPI003C5DD5AA
MSRRTETIPVEYFDQKYRLNIDPWQFRTSDYEQAKYQATIGALGRPRFANALEIGCSIGVLTGLLASRCAAITAIDASAIAIAAARKAGISNVTFEVGTLPRDFPPGQFDLIVLSEVLYYFSAVDLRCVATLCAESLLPNGEVVLCHWLGDTDYPLTGQAASELFAEAIAFRLPVREIRCNDVYRLERLSAT